VHTVIDKTSDSEPAGFAPIDPGGTRILILDDEPLVLALMGELLEILGYSCVSCSAPEEALKRLEEEQFDVVLSDFCMPHMNGERFYAAAVGAHPELKGRIVFLTGDTLNEVTNAFLERVKAPHLTKPFQLNSIQETISNVMAQANG
jgi:CheY-like chemotaxis protein